MKYLSFIDSLIHIAAESIPIAASSNLCTPSPPPVPFLLYPPPPPFPPPPSSTGYFGVARNWSEAAVLMPCTLAPYQILLAGPKFHCRTASVAEFESIKSI